MDKRKQTPRSTDAIVLKRVNQIYDMLLLGFSRVQIIEFGLKNDWNVVDGTVDQYISKANKRYAEASAIVRDEQLGLAISRLNHLLQKNMSIQDYKTALSAQKELNALLGLYAPKTAINVNIDFKLLEELVALADKHGIAASDIFQEMINRLAQVESNATNSAINSE